MDWIDYLAFSSWPTIYVGMLLMGLRLVPVPVAALVYAFALLQWLPAAVRSVITCGRW
jgi:hypothetical protein